MHYSNCSKIYNTSDSKVILLSKINHNYRLIFVCEPLSFEEYTSTTEVLSNSQGFILTRLVWLRTGNIHLYPYTIKTGLNNIYQLNHKYRLKKATLFSNTDLKKYFNPSWMQ